MGQFISRRSFLKSAAAAGAMYSLMPNTVLGANEKVNLACVGIGNQGKSIIKTFHQKGIANVVALCDVDLGNKHTQEIMEMFPDARRFKDFRKMFDEMADQIDAVSIAIPDHSHFPVAMLSMSLGKHIYVEKPLAHTFEEVDLLMKAEKKYKVSAQMGNQGHSGNNFFQFKAWQEAGIIKNITHVDAFMNSPRRWHGWEIYGYPMNEKMPDTLDWDLWLTTAQQHPFSEKLHPGNWRSWYDFGNGAFGDWGPHILDTVHRFMNLGLPSEIKAERLDGPNPYIFPQASTITFSFPARKAMPPMTITWYDGVKNRPPRPKELEERREVRDNGKFIYTDDLVFMGGTHSDTLRIIPEQKMRDMNSKIPRLSGKHSDHYLNFLLAAKGEEKTRSSFNISGPLTQVFLLGVIAQRLGGTLAFDRKTQTITNNHVANQLLVGPPPRKEWEEFYHL